VTAKHDRPPKKLDAERTPEEIAKAESIDMRCLSLCIGMLERVNGVCTFFSLLHWVCSLRRIKYPQTFEENSTLNGILRDLILPAVNSKEMAMREKGLVSLGLCCLITRVQPVLAVSRNGNPWSHSVSAYGAQLVPTLHEGNAIIPGSPQDSHSTSCVRHPHGT